MLNYIKKIKGSWLLTFVFVFILCTGNVMAGTLWDGSGASTAIQNFSAFYQHWFIIILGVAVAVFSFTGNEKVKGYAQGVIIGSILIYLLTWEPVQNLVKNTLQAIPTWF